MCAKYRTPKLGQQDCTLTVIAVGVKVGVIRVLVWDRTESSRKILSIFMEFEVKFINPCIK